VLRGLRQIGDPDGAGQLGVDPVDRPHQLRGAIEQGRGAHGVEVVGGQSVQRRCQLAHGNLPTRIDQVFEVYR
jgi:hypothetical protein